MLNDKTKSDRRDFYFSTDRISFLYGEIFLSLQWKNKPHPRACYSCWNFIASSCFLSSTPGKKLIFGTIISVLNFPFSSTPLLEKVTRKLPKSPSWRIPPLVKIFGNSSTRFWITFATSPAESEERSANCFASCFCVTLSPYTGLAYHFLGSSLLRGFAFSTSLNFIIALDF